MDGLEALALTFVLNALWQVPLVVLDMRSAERRLHCGAHGVRPVSMPWGDRSIDAGPPRCPASCTARAVSRRSLV